MTGPASGALFGIPVWVLAAFMILAGAGVALVGLAAAIHAAAAYRKATDEQVFSVTRAQMVVRLAEEAVEKFSPHIDAWIRSRAKADTPLLSRLLPRLETFLDDAEKHDRPAES